MTGHSKWGNIRHRRGTLYRQAAPELREVTYEGYGPGGTAVMVACATRHPERALAGVRAAFAGHGGALGAAGSVAYLFNEVGLLTFLPGVGGQAIAAVALAAGAEDVIINGDGSVEVLTDPPDLAQITAALERAGLRAEAADITRRSSVNVRLGDRDAASMLLLLEELASLDAVRDVYCNADIPEDVLARLDKH